MRRFHTLLTLTILFALTAAAAQAQTGKAPSKKPKGRRDLSTSDLPRFLLEIRDDVFDVLDADGEADVVR